MTVYILGGGVAGLTAAHELADRGFNVTLFEQHDICGGKARSMKNSSPNRNDLPGEHGFRFFPGFYWHVPHTMQRIVVDPLSGRTALQNLVTAEDIAIAQDGKPLFFITAKHPNTLLEWLDALRAIVENPQLGISLNEARFFVRKIICFVGSGRTRRLAQYEGTSWWDFLEAQTKSSQYQAILARGLSQSLVAMRPDKASALTVGTMLVQILFNIIEGKSADRVLNAPTNDAWIDPWVKELRQRANVKILNNHVVTQINYTPALNAIVSVAVRDTVNNTTQTVGSAGDFFISALPVEVLQTNGALFPTAFKRAAGISRPNPSGSGVDHGVDSLETEWMTGVLFYMNRDVSKVRGHVIYSHSPWALTSVTQRHFWGAGYQWGNIGNGMVRDILSTIISDWDTPGNKVVTKPAKQCKRQEILDETWAQLSAHLAQAGHGAITPGDLVETFIDPAIKFDGSGNVLSNDEPLLVNTRNSRLHRPRAATNIKNFFVASDYVLTETDLACMEAANEAARQAVNALLVAAGSQQPPCAIQPLQEPLLFHKFQEIDEIEYATDPSRPPLLCRLVELLEPSAAVTPEHLKLLLIGLLVMAGVNLVMLGALLYMLLGL